MLLCNADCADFMLISHWFASFSFFFLFFLNSIFGRLKTGLFKRKQVFFKETCLFFLFVSCMFCQVLRLSQYAAGQMTPSYIMNLMSNDAHRFDQVSCGRQFLTLMLLVANLARRKWCKNLKNDWNPGIWYSSESTHQELSNEYQHDRVSIVIKDFSILVLRTKVASALEGLTHSI